MYRVIKASQDYEAKITGKGWQNFIDSLEDYGFEIDSAYRYEPEKWIMIIKDGVVYDAEVTRYSDGTYELMESNIIEQR